MYSSVCLQRNLPDIEFFVNRRDFPLFKKNKTEPYEYIFGTDTKLLSHEYDSYSPILSFATSQKYSDILSPTYEDWARVVYQDSKQLINPECKTYPIISSTPWNRKIKKAIFRGATTGSGTTVDTNKRLKAFEIGKTYESLDVGITKWNLRPRKLKGTKQLSTIIRDSYPISNYLTLQEQSKYAYILSIEGHVAAYRLSYELSSGSVILLVESEWKLWFMKWLIPWVHYVPVSGNMSDLISRIEWCKTNYDKCKTIAKNALEFYNTKLNSQAVLDYIQETLILVAKMVGIYNYIPSLLDSQLKREEKWFLDTTSNTINTLRLKQDEAKFKAPQQPRNVASLEGEWMAFQSQDVVRVELIKRLFTSKHSLVDLVKSGPLVLVAKVAKTHEKKQEGIHETFVARKCTNSLLLYIPNFAYVYGHLHNVLESDQQTDQLPFRINPKLEMILKTVYIEYIPGKTLLEWLNTEYNWSEWLFLLLQINMALIVAQNTVGFIHYDLAPWNIIVKRIQPTWYYYQLTPDLTIKIETNLVPIIIDFGKSRVVAHDKESGLIDHGFVNLYKTSAIIDTLYLLLTSLDVLGNKVNQQQLFNLSAFLVDTGIPNDVLFKIPEWKKFGVLFGKTENSIKTPIDFVDFIVKQFGPFNNIKISSTGGNNEYFVGFPYLTYSVMKGQSYDVALESCVNKINESTFVKSPNAFLSRQIIRFVNDMVGWLSNEINNNAASNVRQRWFKIYRELIKMPKTDTRLNISYPTPTKLYYDQHITWDFLKQVSATPILDDWASILSMATDAISKGDVIQEDNDAYNFVYRNPFDYINTIASINTLCLIKRENINKLKVLPTE